MSPRLIAPIAGLLLFICRVVPADSYTYLDENRNQVTIEAEAIGESRGFSALQRRDGQIQIVPSSAIVERQPSGEFVAFTRDEMAESLTRRFGEDLVRIETLGDFLVVLVLTAPIEQSAKGRVRTFLGKASRFMNRVDDVFVSYAKSRRLPRRDPQFPLVMLIFESDEDFESYASEATGGNGLSAVNVAGFYSPITNWLAVRMSACDSFEVPLHEAIHLQVYNRILNRLAPIPKWFDEGIATGFEGDGERINISPAKVNPRYARQARSLPTAARWSTVVENDAAFTADVLAGDAYTVAWCIHWLLANEHEEEYVSYVKELAQREPLAELTADERVEFVEQTFGSDVDSLQASFPSELQVAVRRQRVQLDSRRTDGGSSTVQSLGKADLRVVQLSQIGDRYAAAGSFKSMSLLRPMSFYVTVESASGLYAAWHLPNLLPNKSVQLSRQDLNRRYAPAVRMQPGTYRVYIRSTPADSDTAAAWENGQLPGAYLQSAAP